VVGWANHGFPRRQTVSRESDGKLGRPMDKIDTFCGTNQYERSQDESFAGTLLARGGHETGFCTFDVLHALMREAPMLGRPNRVSLTDGAKIKADEATEDLRK
jgi:hypothetical protein